MYLQEQKVLSGYHQVKERFPSHKALFASDASRRASYDHLGYLSVFTKSKKETEIGLN